MRYGNRVLKSSLLTQQLYLVALKKKKRPVGMEMMYYYFLFQSREISHSKYVSVKLTL